MERDIDKVGRMIFVDNFNSHAHVERDNYPHAPCKIKNISTHTLTWSVTCKDDTVRIAGENFNSHAHVERDPCMYGDFQNFRNFNSHAHVERDWGGSKGKICQRHFNSHAHVERDMLKHFCI